jgi:hypothetical protein
MDRLLIPCTALSHKPGWLESEHLALTMFKHHMIDREPAS